MTTNGNSEEFSFDPTEASKKFGFTKHNLNPSGFITKPAQKARLNVLRFKMTNPKRYKVVKRTIIGVGVTAAVAGATALVVTNPALAARAATMTKVGVNATKAAATNPKTITFARTLLVRHAKVSVATGVIATAILTPSQLFINKLVKDEHPLTKDVDLDYIDVDAKFVVKVFIKSTGASVVNPINILFSSVGTAKVLAYPAKVVWTLRGVAWGTFLTSVFYKNAKKTTKDGIDALERMANGQFAKIKIRREFKKTSAKVDRQWRSNTERDTSLAVVWNTYIVPAVAKNGSDAFSIELMTTQDYANMTIQDMELVAHTYLDKVPVDVDYLTLFASVREDTYKVDEAHKAAGSELASIIAEHQQHRS